jgi:hypothetical protein
MRQKTLDDMEPVLDDEVRDDPFSPDISVKNMKKRRLHALRIYDHLEERRLRKEAEDDPLF